MKVQDQDRHRHFQRELNALIIPIFGKLSCTISSIRRRRRDGIVTKIAASAWRSSLTDTASFRRGALPPLRASWSA
jgi:hypothetical protein